MKVRIRRSSGNAKHARAPSANGHALSPAFSEGQWYVPERFNLTRDVVENLASDPKRRALMYLGPDGVIEPRTFVQLAESAARWAAVLREHDVRPGDRVLVLAGRTTEWLEVMLAGIKVGAVMVPCPETLSSEAFGVRLESSGAKLVVAARRAESAIAEAEKEVSVVYTDERRGRASDPVPDEPTEDTAAKDVAVILSTSGTVRGPLGVAHTHGSLFAARVQAEHWLDAGPRDSVWCTADTSSALAAWHVLAGPWSRGAEIILHHGEFDPHERLDLIDRLGTTVLCQSPSEYAALVELREFRRYRPRRLRRLVSTGDTLDPEVLAAYEDVWGMTIHEGYGQAETGVIVANGIDTGFRAGSVGLPIAGQEVAVIDDQGNVVEPGVEGELALKGRPPSLFAHYWGDPDETKAAFRGDWYVTGDLATTDEDGFVWVLGRAGDVIASRGRRFGPTGVERALRAHGSVAESAVVGIRDLERGGQFVRAFVVLRPGVEPNELVEAELRHFVGESLPEYEVPREIEFVEDLPRTPGGNIRRIELRERPVVGHSLWEAPPVVEPDPLVFSVETVPVPEAAPRPKSEPVAFVELPVSEPVPEPAPAPVVEPEPFSAPLDEPIVLTEPPPIVLSEPQAIVLPEPEAIVLPEPGAIVMPEPGAIVMPEPEPIRVPEPEAISPREPDPEPVALVEPTVDPAPEPVPEAPVEPPPAPFEHEPEPVFLAPVHEPGPVSPTAAPEPEPVSPAPAPEPAAYEPPPPPEPLPDYVVVPGSERSAPPAADLDPGSRPAPGSDAATGSGDAPTLGFPTAPSLDLDRPDAPVKRSRREKRKHPPESDAKPGTKPGARRSAGEPGDESDEVDWMQGLSTRLSAYSLAQDEAEDDAPDDASPGGEEPGESDADD